jgi:hypothetical protein
VNNEVIIIFIKKQMGGGIAGWLTPGWMIHDHRLAPHIKRPDYVNEMIKAGEDPKSLLLEECKPQCEHWKGRLERCEAKLEHVIKINPTKTCLYPYRDFANCTEACVQPLIHNLLEGTK